MSSGCSGVNLRAASNSSDAAARPAGVDCWASPVKSRRARARKARALSAGAASGGGGEGGSLECGGRVGEGGGERELGVGLGRPVGAGQQQAERDVRRREGRV